MTDDPDRLESEYEAAEAAFLDAVRRGVPRTDLAVAAKVVADAGAGWNSEAYRRLFAAEVGSQDELDRLTERTEFLSELWADLADAFGA